MQYVVSLNTTNTFKLKVLSFIYLFFLYIHLPQIKCDSTHSYVIWFMISFNDF